MGRYRKFLLRDEAITLALKYDEVEQSITIYSPPRFMIYARAFLDELIVTYTEHSNCAKHPNRCWLKDTNRYTGQEFEQLLKDFERYWFINECKSLKRWESRVSDMNSKIPNSWEKYLIKHPAGDIGFKYNPLYRTFIIGSQHRHREHVKLIFNSLWPERMPKVTQFGYHTYRLSIKISDVDFNRVLGELRQTYEVIRAVNMKGVTR